MPLLPSVTISASIINQTDFDLTPEGQSSLNIHTSGFWNAKPGKRGGGRHGHVEGRARHSRPDRRPRLQHRRHRLVGASPRQEPRHRFERVQRGHLLGPGRRGTTAAVRVLGVDAGRMGPHRDRQGLEAVAPRGTLSQKPHRRCASRFAAAD
jgi:hypothetical protein